MLPARLKELLNGCGKAGAFCLTWLSQRHCELAADAAGRWNSCSCWRCPRHPRNLPRRRPRSKRTPETRGVILWLAWKGWTCGDCWVFLIHNRLQTPTQPDSWLWLLIWLEVTRCFLFLILLVWPWSSDEGFGASDAPQTSNVQTFVPKLARISQSAMNVFSNQLQELLSSCRFCTQFASLDTLRSL